jgi:hypothetical protein
MLLTTIRKALRVDSERVKFQCVRRDDRDPDYNASQLICIASALELQKEYARFHWLVCFIDFLLELGCREGAALSYYQILAGERRQAIEVDLSAGEEPLEDASSLDERAVERQYANDYCKSLHERLTQCLISPPRHKRPWCFVLYKVNWRGIHSALSGAWELLQKHCCALVEPSAGRGAKAYFQFLHNIAMTTDFGIDVAEPPVTSMEKLILKIKYRVEEEYHAV